MKIFLKIFSIAFLSFVILFSSLTWTFNRFMKDNHPNQEELIIRAEEPEEEEFEPEEIDEFKKLIKSSDRVNMVVMGLEGVRSDTMMFISFNPKTKKMDIISLPRDTYYHRKGYDRLDKRKLNSVYGDHGATGVKTVVSDLLLDVPVHYYVTVTYKGAAAIIDSLGGVPVSIPRLMKYEDLYESPPLKIHFEPGNYVLNGTDGVKFLRYRQASPGSGGMSYVDGDLGRIKAQQEFMKAAFKKALSFKLPTVASTAFKHVRTDMPLQELLKQATNAIGTNMEKVTMQVLPGEDRYQSGASYYFHDIEGVKELLTKIYTEDEGN